MISALELEEKFAERLALLRNEKGVSARDMSLSIGQNPGYINNIENKHNLPSMACFFYICEYLNITPQDFFSFDVKYPEKLNEVIEDLKSLKPEQFEHICAVIKDLKK